MTTSEWHPDYDALLQLPAGHELDQAIAQLAGWVVLGIETTLYSKGRQEVTTRVLYHLFDPDNVVVGHSLALTEAAAWSRVPAFSTDLNVIMPVAQDAISIRCPTYLETWGPGRWRRYCDNAEMEVLAEVTADTNALALCRLILMLAASHQWAAPGLTGRHGR